jgi:hypothetical protein
MDEVVEFTFGNLTDIQDDRRPSDEDIDTTHMIVLKLTLLLPQVGVTQPPTTAALDVNLLLALALLQVALLHQQLAQPPPQSPRLHLVALPPQIQLAVERTVMVSFLGFTLETFIASKEHLANAFKSAQVAHAARLMVCIHRICRQLRHPTRTVHEHELISYAHRLVRNH